jgi:hypothetical protein
MGKAAGIALLALGFALGPGTYIFSKFFSGRMVFEAPLRFKVAPDGRQHAHIRFSLPTDALPATVVVQASASHGPALLPASPPGDTWRLSLRKDGRAVREQAIQLQSNMVEASSALVFKESLPLDTTLGSGDYALDIAQPSEPQLTLDSARVSVRAKVDPVNPDLVIAGLVLLAIGAALSMWA